MDIASRSRKTNEDYYFQIPQGRLDYWTHMAAPRFRVKQFLKMIAQFKPGSIVDLGCGNGELLLEIKRRFPAIHLAGVDFSSQQIEQNMRADTSVEWHWADLDGADPLPGSLTEKFDLVIASEIIEHVNHPSRLLEKARAMAVTGKGIMLLSTQSGKVWTTERNVGHIRHFSVDEMSGALAETGWKPMKIWNTGYPFHDCSKWYANLNPQKTMRQFNDRPYGIFEKTVCWGLRAAFWFNSSKRGAQLFAMAKKEAEAHGN